MTPDRPVHDHFEVFPAQYWGAGRRGLVPVAVLLALAVAARQSTACRSGLVALSLAALRSPERWEGLILIVFKESRGITTTDVAGLAGLYAARRTSRRARLTAAG